MNLVLEHLMSRIYDGALSLEHLRDLRKSALSDAMIREQHVRSVPPWAIGRLLGYDPPKVVSAMLLPYVSADGGFMDMVRLKLFPSQVDRDGHGFKYAQPKGSQPRLYFVRRCLRQVLRTDDRLLICEGEKKSMALAQLGYAVVGIAGVEAWHTKGDRRLLADFGLIPLRDRLAEIVPDGDYGANENVRRAIQRLGTALADRGARPRVVLLPQEQPQ
jgi:hypothetical protein